MKPATYRYYNEGRADPIVVREVKWLLDKLAFVLFGWWLYGLQARLPALGPTIKQVPNSLSIIRIPLSFLAAWVLARSFVNDNTTNLWRCLACIGALVLLDGIDGPLARQLDAVSDFGKAIDPAADKALVVALAVSLTYSITRLQSQASGMLLMIIFGWALYLEARLVWIAKQIKTVHNQVPTTSLPGANVYGKIKFSIQAISLLVAIAWLIRDPISELAVGVLAIAIVVASVFARFSLAGHRDDLEYLRDQVRLIDQSAQTSQIIEPVHD